MKNKVLAVMVLLSAFSLSAAPRVDPNLTVFLSDIHIEGGTNEVRHQNALFSERVEEVLEMDPRPARAVIFGDIARFHGKSVDYDLAKSLLKKLQDAMPVHLTTGNHDHRLPMSAAFPSAWSASPVPGRFTSVIDLGSVDLILLDSLHETGGEGQANKGDGELGQPQFDWLMKTAAERTRPFFVGSHHSPDDIHDFGAQALAALAKNMRFSGWIHGHDHFWRKGIGRRAWNDDAGLSRYIYRILTLPSTGYWGDIGYVVVTTSPSGAEFRNVERDFFFHRPLKPGEKRPPNWDNVISENSDNKVVVNFVQ